MRTAILAALAASCALASAAVAQPAGPSASAGAHAPAKYAVDKTPVGVIWADPKGRAVLLKQLPMIEMYIDGIKEMTLVQVAPQSGGVIDDAKLKAIQSDLDAAT